MNKPAIVVVCYNRPDSLKRLLTSLDKASYQDEVALVISVDNSGDNSVVEIANKYDWTHGTKRVIHREKRMGLKAHVLACGDLVNEYGSIIVLEDDLYVSPSFYEYTVRALDFMENDDRIGGVSLYNHLFNVHARRSFCAIDDGFDNWYFQFASSWGQAYTKNQWNGFKAWMKENDGKDLAKAEVPFNVSSWSDKSWLKYYIAYLIDTDKYFLYPRISFTTNFGDVGSHAVKADCDLQVPLAGHRYGREFVFSNLNESKAVYDAFFENKFLTGPDNEVLVNLYGTKPDEEFTFKHKNIKYILTSQALPFKVVKSYGRLLRPLDANIVYEAEGDDIKLYDISVRAKEPKEEDEAEKYLYEYRGISASQMTSILKYRVKEKLKNK